MYYNIYIGTHNDGFDEDDMASASGDAIEGDVLIYINNNCISRYSGYGTTIQINQWLKKGENKYSFVGASSKKIYIKIVKYNSKGKDFKVLAKKTIDSGNIENSGVFKVDSEYSLPLFKSDIPNDRTKVKKELSEMIETIQHLFEEKDRTKLNEILIAGRAIWQPLAYNDNWSVSEPALKKKLYSQYIRGQKKLIKLNPNELKYVFGSNSIYVYSGVFRDEIFRNDYLFKFKKKDNSLFILPAIKFVWLNNKWIVWE